MQSSEWIGGAEREHGSEQRVKKRNKHMEEVWIIPALPKQTKGRWCSYYFWNLIGWI